MRKRVIFFVGAIALALLAIYTGIEPGDVMELMKGLENAE